MPATVAPYVGVWIETIMQTYLTPSMMSHPMWVCGLKHRIRVRLGWLRCVAPYVGVWIETGGRTPCKG